MTGQINQRDSQGWRHGLWEWYRSDGTVRWRGHYLHGKPYGGWEWYYKDGTLEWKEYFLKIK